MVEEVVVLVVLARWGKLNWRCIRGVFPMTGWPGAYLFGGPFSTISPLWVCRSFHGCVCGYRSSQTFSNVITPLVMLPGMAPWANQWLNTSVRIGTNMWVTTTSYDSPAEINASLVVHPEDGRALEVVERYQMLGRTRNYCFLKLSIID